MAESHMPMISKVAGIRSSSRLSLRNPGSARRATRFSLLESLENRAFFSMTYTVTTPADSGLGSLRQAVLNANQNPGVDTIRFNIAPSGPQIIGLLSPLPKLTDAVTIDATTEPGYTGQPLIQLDGSKAGAGAVGLDLAGGGSTIKGLDIVRFGGAGIFISNLGGNALQGNWIGIDTTGNAAGNDEGVVVQSDANLIGGAGGRNVISGNASDGVRIGGSAGSFTGNVISANFIGSDAGGQLAIGNGDGIVLDHATNTRITLDTIFGNNGNGIRVANSSFVVIGGGSAGRNVISASGGDGIQIGTSHDVSVTGNYIGTDATGAAIINAQSLSLGNSGNGINLRLGAYNNSIGGATADARNLIDGSSGNGIIVATGATAYNLIQGNYIGTDASGTLALGGFGNGVYVTSPGASILGNVISASGGDGVVLSAATLLQGNRIGTTADGSAALPNLADGITVMSSGSTIGGPMTGQGNVIAFNTGIGVDVLSGAQNAIRGNSIYGNAQLGIDLGGDGATANHPLPGNGGPNNAQNFPILSNILFGDTATTLSVSLTGGVAGNSYTIDFFASSAVDPSGFGQGQVYLGSATITTDASGGVTQSVTISALPAGKHFVSATATDSAGNTSEFSASVQATPAQSKSTTQTTLSSASGSVALGQSITLNAMISGGNNSTGSVMFEEVLSNGTLVPLGTATVSGDAASFVVSGLSVGTHTIIAVYGGDTNNSPSTSGSLTQIVKTGGARISGTTFRDLTGDGPSADDAPMAGVTVNLFRDLNGNGVYDAADGAPVSTLVTDSNGTYAFTGLAAGKYIVKEVDPSGYVRTGLPKRGEYAINAAAESVFTDQNFDNFQKGGQRQFLREIGYQINDKGPWFTNLNGRLHEGDKLMVRFIVAVNHSLTLSLVSYNAPLPFFSESKANLETVYRSTTATFSSGPHTMQVDVPANNFQVDFVIGGVIEHFGAPGSHIFYTPQGRLIGSAGGGVHAPSIFSTKKIAA